MKKLLFPVGIALSMLLIAGSVFASSWATHPLTSTGSVVVNPVPTTNTTSVNTTVLVFGDTAITLGSPFSLTASVLISNTGTQPVAGLDVTIAGVPTNVNVSSNASGGLAVGESKVITFTASGTPAGTGTISLATVTANITPN